MLALRTASLVFSLLGFASITFAQPYAYVSAVAGNTVTVVNTANASVVTMVPVPAGPTRLAVTPDGRYVYVPSQGAASVSIIDTGSNTVVKTVSVGATPVDVSITPNGVQAYVVNQASNTVSVIDTASQSVIATIGVGSNPVNVAFSPDNTRAYVANLLSNNVTVIDTSSRSAISTFAALAGPNGIAVTPNGRYLYVANQYSNAVTVHDISSGSTLATISGLNAPNALAITPNGSRAFVVNGNGGSVSIIDTASNGMMSTVATGPIPTSIAISPDGTRAYVTNEYGFTLSVIDTGSNALVNTIQRVAVYPVGVAMAPAAVQIAPPPAPVGSAKASFVNMDSNTQGNWRSRYGADGYVVIDDSTKNPGYGSVTPLSQFDYVWASSTGDVRALQKASANDRMAATWYSSSPYYLDVNFTDQSAHQVAVYCLDWDVRGRAQTIDVLDAATNALLDSRAVSNFSSGTYAVWNITGHVKLRITVTSGINGVVSGIFFGGGSGSAGSTATFISADISTQGNWTTRYGGEGFTVVDDSTKNAAYASVAPSGAADYVWNSGPSDIRGLQRVSTGGRIAATWYSSSSFLVDVNIADQSTHQIAVYCVDWDYQGRSQTVDVLDGTTNAVLSSRGISGYTNGVYLVWNVTGHVKLRFTTNSGPNAVMSGIFFGGPAAASATFLGADLSTQGSWKSKYGLEGYTVIDESTNNPGYAVMAPSGALDYVWASSTGDIRALQKGSATDRIAATWYGWTSFLIDLNLTDQATHQVGAYFVDYDWQGRGETVDILDANTNAVLDTRSLSSFTNGIYLFWNVSGHVKLRITRTAGINAVISGIFFH